jgi:hypothetical protein
MSSKEDILEQLVEEYLIHRGYFVRHNVKFLPRQDHPEFEPNQDSNHSDIDVMAYNPKLRGPNRVWAVSCKSWQAGFNPAARIRAIAGNKVLGGREAWRGFRELVKPKWSDAFVAAVSNATGQSKFTYVTAVTKLIGDRDCWEQNAGYRKALQGNPIKIITLKEMLDEVWGEIGTTVAGTELGRTLQLFRAAGISNSQLEAEIMADCTT